jgi:chaperonin cofactor prefoldin
LILSHPETLVATHGRMDRISFQQQDHSLKIPVSRIAAIAGFHPYTVLPELFLDFVYQGSIGNELREFDCKDLGIELVSHDVLLRELALKAGPRAKKALDDAILVKQGSKQFQDITAANVLKKSIMEEAKRSKNLTSDEIKRLIEGTRSYIDTGFGTHNEEDALDLFEKQCGWEIRERNSSIVYWPFQRSRDIVTDSNKEPTVVPLTTFSESKDFQSTALRQISEPVESSVGDHCKPFFILCGAVDGIRDELWCRSASIESKDEEDWELRQVIVECKHRMRRAFSTPPLYDQIQTTAYCLMYGADVADILQVIRRNSKEKGEKDVRLNNKRQKLETSKATIKKDLGTSGQSCLDHFFKQAEDLNVSQGNNNIKNKKKQEMPKDLSDRVEAIDIHVTRLTLDDDMNHRRNWDDIVLPRLRSFVDAVYRIRADDEARKLFLLLVLQEENSGYATKVSWDMLHQECPWLRYCDTAFHRN